MGVLNGIRLKEVVRSLALTQQYLSSLKGATPSGEFTHCLSLSSTDKVFDHFVKEAEKYKIDFNSKYMGKLPIESMYGQLINSENPALKKRFEILFPKTNISWLYSQPLSIMFLVPDLYPYKEMAESASWNYSSFYFSSDTNAYKVNRAIDNFDAMPYLFEHFKENKKEDMLLQWIRFSPLLPSCIPLILEKFNDKQIEKATNKIKDGHYSFLTLQNSFQRNKSYIVERNNLFLEIYKTRNIYLDEPTNAFCHNAISDAAVQHSEFLFNAKNKSLDGFMKKLWNGYNLMTMVESNLMTHAYGDKILNSLHKIKQLDNYLEFSDDLLNKTTLAIEKNSISHQLSGKRAGLKIL